MTNTGKRPPPPSYKVVNVSERWSVQYWMTALGCSETELHAAVADVGDDVLAVRKCLEVERRRAPATT